MVRIINHLKSVGWVVLLSGLSVKGLGQTPQANKPNSQTQAPAGTATVRSVQGTYGSGANVSYIRLREAMGIVSDANYETAGYADVQETNQYVDGVGRPLQTVVRQNSPGSAPTDAVSPMLYDPFGRETYKYLPYASTATDGKFKLNPFVDQAAFVQTKYPGEAYYYGKTNYEASPLNRVLEAFSPGNSWAGSEGSSTAEHAVKMEYLTNSATDGLRKWTITTNNLTYANDDQATNIPATSATYAAYEVFKNVTIDEAGSAVVEYKDKEGKVLLKKVQVANSVPSDYSGYTGFLCTYYIYDDLNQLRFVIPPKAVETIKTNWTLTTDIINELCFRYEYDQRGRMIAKKIPGAGWVYMVYDRRDRLVFTQDANMRITNNWLTTLYDLLNRQVLTAMITYSGNRDALQSYVDQHTGSGTSGQVTTNQAVPTDLFVDEQAAGTNQYVAQASITFNPEFSSETGAEFETILEAGSTSEDILVVDNPVPPGSNLIALTITYYDNYDWTTRTYSTTNNSKLSQQAGSAPHAVSIPSTAFGQVQNRVTGTKVRVIEDASALDMGQMLPTVNFYDDHGRVIQAQAENYKNGWDVVTSQYDFVGKVLGTYLEHHNPAAGPEGDVSVLTTNSFDAQGRLLEIWKIINDDIAKKALIANNSYDNLGQLVSKELGRKKDPGTGNYTSTPLETLDYEYNIRGWLKGINKSYANSTSSTSHWFGMELNYDWGFGTNQYSGNISGTKWKSTGDDMLRSYGYTYDRANRILGADFAQYNGSAYADNSTLNFDMSMGDGVNFSSAYDENGNIKAMNQWGYRLGGSLQIDKLSYAYFTNSNKLKSVSELANGTTNLKLGDFTDKNPTGDDYGYDKNGNMATDLNKRIVGLTGLNLGGGGAIVYNYLNLPWRIPMQNDGDQQIKGIIWYIYDAMGNKLEKRVREFPSTTNGNQDIKTNTTYIAGMVYENDKLQFILHEEGRTRYLEATATTAAHFEHDYFIKDHLGSVRMVLTEELRTDAYPKASLETENAEVEDAFYANLAETRTALPANYPHDDYADPGENHYVAKVRGDGQMIGPSITLKVMAGDEFNIKVSSYYKLNGSTPDPNIPNPLPDLLLAIANGIAGAGNKFTSTEISSSGVLSTAAGTFLQNQTYNSSRPKAYLNWVLLDEQFKLVAECSSFQQVGDESSGDVEHIIRNNLPITKNGYLYIYVSNVTSNIDVFFDNLQVTHVRGPLLEETHYYPFGLSMNGISIIALDFGGSANKYKFGEKELQANEFSDNSGLILYDFQARDYDQQIGRWWSNDPKADKSFFVSPYNYCLSNPIKLFDPDGKFPYPIHIRSFAPWKSFGFGFGGDNRGYSTALGKGEGGTVTSRIQQTFTVDPSKGTYTAPRTWSDPSHHSLFGRETGKPTGKISDFKSSTDKDGNSTVSFTSTFAGNLPLIPSADIDVKTSFTLVENAKAGTLKVTATQKGDAYPVAETLIGDTKGNQLFIGVSPATGQKDQQQSLGPFQKLPGDNNRDMMSSSFVITIDKNGVFTGVIQGDKTYTVAEWNEMMRTKPLVKNDEKNLPVH